MNRDALAGFVRKPVVLIEMKKRGADLLAQLLALNQAVAAPDRRRPARHRPWPAPPPIPPPPGRPPPTATSPPPF